MKKVITREVAHYWRCSESACNHSAQFWTDGDKIYSYRLPIGYTTPDGEKVALDYTANGSKGFKSMTTSKHVGYARARATVIE
jgi:YD repeat-containing protein